MATNLIDFNISVGKKKPRTMNGEQAQCPFCDVEHLTNIIDTESDMILLRNKYNVLVPSEQFVLIESSVCHSDMPDYSPEKMHQLIHFGLKHWLELRESGKYDSVIFFKNHGPLSGGTIKHPHMQIIAFPSIDESLMYDPEEFQGIHVIEKNKVEINVCNHPRIGFSEINLLVKEKISSAQLTADDYFQSETFPVVNTLALFIQDTICFINDFFQRENLSYNIFFYVHDGYIRVKIMPRFATSPLYIGYNIHLLPTNVNEQAKLLRQHILQKN